MWLVAGLGNPGPAYAGHRHNVGYLVTTELASRMGEGFRCAQVGAGRRGRGTAGVARPPRPAGRARSPALLHERVGRPVKALATFYKVEPAQVVAIHDELDIPFGTLRVKLGGGDNGHNGLRSMRSSFGTGDFHRVRVGIGRPTGRQDVSDFVLSDFSATERKDLAFEVARAADAVESLVLEGLEKTQQTFNS